MRCKRHQRERHEWGKSWKRKLTFMHGDESQGHPADHHEGAHWHLLLVDGEWSRVQ